MLVVMTERTVLKVSIEKAAPLSCLFDLPAPLEIRNIAFCIILALNNNPLEDFSKRFLFCREIYQL